MRFPEIMHLAIKGFLVSGGVEHNFFCTCHGSSFLYVLNYSTGLKGLLPEPVCLEVGLKQSLFCYYSDLISFTYKLGIQSLILANPFHII